MKTILVIFTNTKIEPGQKQRYAFNTENVLKEGDLVKSSQYDTAMQVVAILPHFKFFNKVTGELSNKHNNLNQYPIKELVIGKEKEAVYACVL